MNCIVRDTIRTVINSTDATIRASLLTGWGVDAEIQPRALPEEDHVPRPVTRFCHHHTGDSVALKLSCAPWHLLDEARQAVWQRVSSQGMYTQVRSADIFGNRLGRWST